MNRYGLNNLKLAHQPWERTRPRVPHYPEAAREAGCAPRTHLCATVHYVFLLVATFSLVTFAQAQSTNAGARVWEAPLTIPTYELGPPDPNPPLFDSSRTRRRPVYPYPMLDTLTKMKQTERRIKLLEGASEKARARPALLQSLAAAYVDAGQFADAIRLLEQNTFTSGEDEGIALGIYRRAYLALARQHQQSGRHSEAAAAFIKATEFPRNFGVGREAMRSQAREYVAAARELEAAGKRDEAEKWWRRAAEEALNSPTQPEEPWSEHYYYKAVALDHVRRKVEARALYQRLARLNDEQQMLAAEPSPPRGALRFLLAGWGLKALGKNQEARAAFQRVLQLDPANNSAQAELDRLSR